MSYSSGYDLAPLPRIELGQFRPLLSGPEPLRGFRSCARLAQVRRGLCRDILFEVFDCLADSFDFFGVIVGHLDFKLIFHCHYQLNFVHRIAAQVVDEVRFARQFLLDYTQLFRYNFLYALFAVCFHSDHSVRCGWVAGYAGRSAPNAVQAGHAGLQGNLSGLPGLSRHDYPTFASSAAQPSSGP